MLRVEHTEEPETKQQTNKPLGSGASAAAPQQVKNKHVVLAANLVEPIWIVKLTECDGSADHFAIQFTGLHLFYYWKQAM